MVQRKRFWTDPRGKKLSYELRLFAESRKRTQDFPNWADTINKTQDKLIQGENRHPWTNFFNCSPMLTELLLSQRQRRLHA
jgi:hypothetical protein